MKDYDAQRYEALMQRLYPMVIEDRRFTGSPGMATHTEEVLRKGYMLMPVSSRRHLFAVIEEMIGGMERMEALELYSVRFDCQTEGLFTGRYTECEEWIAGEAVAVMLGDVAYAIDNATDDEVAAWRAERVKQQEQVA